MPADLYQDHTFRYFEVLRADQAGHRERQRSRETPPNFAGPERNHAQRVHADQGVEALSGRCVAFSRQKEVDRRTGGVDRRYKYTHLPLTLM